MTDKNNNNLQQNSAPLVQQQTGQHELPPLLHSFSEPSLDLHVKELGQSENELVNSHGSSHHRTLTTTNLVGASPQLAKPNTEPSSPTLTDSIGCESIELPTSFKQRLISFALEPHGKWAAFAGKFVNFLDLDNPTKELSMKIPAQNYDINAIDWAKSKAESNYIATAVSTDVTVWNFGSPQKSPELLYKLSGHKRFVSDIAWSPFELTNLASCAADGFVHLWDIRDYAGKPAKQFKSFSAAPLKVKWNRKNSHQFLTCHGSEVRIWDSRKEQAPLETIMAHVAAITTLDWSFKKEIEFLTASQDKQVKFWHTTKPKAPQETLQVGAAVHLASYTPFGRGLVTLSRFDNALKLWCLSDLTHPIHVFSGHKDEVVSYAWRPEPDSEGFQLVTISKDLNLRLWTLDTRTVDAIRATNPAKLKKQLEKENKPNQNHPTDLAQEFSLIKKQMIPGIQFKELNIQSRCATCTIENDSGRLDIRATFPELYPRGAAPNFELLTTSTLKLAVLSKLAKILSETAQRRAEHNQPCLEHCLSKVVLLLKNQRSFRKLEKFDPVSEELSPSNQSLSPGVVQFHVIPIHMESNHNQSQDGEIDIDSSNSGDILEIDDSNSSSDLSNRLENGQLDEEQPEYHTEHSNMTPKKRRKHFEKVHSNPTTPQEHHKASRSFYNYPPHHNFTIKHPHCSINDGDNNYDHSENTELDKEDIEPNPPSKTSTSSLPFAERLSSFFKYLKSSRQETKTPPSDVPTYTVKPTDTLTGIAINFNLKPEQLKQWNKLYSNQLIPGQVLYVENPNLPNSTGKTRQHRSVTVNETLLSKGRELEQKTAVVKTVSVDDNALVEQHKKDTLEPPTPAPTEPPSPRTKSQTLKEQMMSKYNKNKSETPVEVIKEPARYANLNFTVYGMLTVTPDVVIFEPDLSDKLVLKNGLLPYQVVIYVKDIFDCQIIRENPNYLYENSLEISALQNNTVGIFDFLIEEKKMRIIHRKLINWTSSSNQKAPTTSSPQTDRVLMTHSQEQDEEIVDIKTETFVPSLSRPSAILSSEDLVKINRHLPNRFRYMDWKLLYGTQVHGISLNTFYLNLEDAGPSIMVVEDKDRNMFGCFASDSWRIEPHYYGNGECFMFTLKPYSRFYHWSQKNSNFMCSRKDFVAMGGGRHGFGLWIDNEFNNGSTYECDTFDSEPLTKAEDFQITVVEVWGFKGY